MKYLFFVATVVSIAFFVFSSGSVTQYAPKRPLVSVQAVVKKSSDKALFESLAQEYKDTAAFSIRLVLPISIRRASLSVNGDIYAPPFEKDVIRTLLNAEILKERALARGEEVHEHVDFVVFINGTPLDFSLPEYQSTSEKELDPDVHLHDGVGTVIHKHKETIRLTEFFSSIGMSLTNDCITWMSHTYCTDNAHSLRMYVNGNTQTDIEAYVMQDLDKVLISYGETNHDVTVELQSITDDACMYSQICPERGKPPTEACVGGLGSDCQ